LMQPDTFEDDLEMMRLRSWSMISRRTALICEKSMRHHRRYSHHGSGKPGQECPCPKVLICVRQSLCAAEYHCKVMKKENSKSGILQPFDFVRIEKCKAYVDDTVCGRVPAVDTVPNRFLENERS
jgi:hypothetical protein